MMATRRMIMTAALAVCAVSTAFSQMTEQDVRVRLDAVYAGKADQITRELPALLQQYPHDGGVLYIQAVLTADGALAVKRYQDIADTYPQSVWADDAMYKVYQYNFSLGLYKKADEVMEQLRSRYPQSIYVNGADAKAAKQDKSAAPVATPAASAEPKTGETTQAAAGAHTDAPAATEKKAAANAEPVKTAAAAETAKPVPATTEHAAGPGKFFVQVGLFSTEANARAAAEKYAALAGRALTVTPKTTGDKTQYFVRFEGFDSAESARSFSAGLRSKHNIDSFVVPNPNAR